LKNNVVLVLTALKELWNTNNNIPSRVELSWVESHRVAVAVEFELKLWREA